MEARDSRHGGQRSVMLEKLEYSGVWWLPSNPGNRIPGRLNFSQDEGAILSLDGSFAGEKNDLLLNPDIINGASSGVDITLYNCLQRGLSYSYSGQATSEFYAHYVFTGIHFEKLEDMKFHCMKVHYSLLDEWLGVTGFETKRDGEEITIKYRCPDSVLALVNNELRLEIVFHYSWSPFMLKEVNLKQASYVRLDTDSKSFDEFQSILRQLQYFLTLAVMEPVFPSFIIGATDFKAWKEGNVINYPQVGIFYQLARFPLPQVRASRFEPLFSFKSVSTKFEKLISNWFRKRELLEPVEQLYFGLFYNPSMYLEQKFLCCIQAVEAYHRRTMNNKELATADYRHRIRTIVENVPQEYRDWLQDKLAYSNEPSLKTRLEELIDKNKVALGDYIGSRVDFVRKVVDTRHYLTHYTAKLSRRASKKNELYQITEKLKMMIEVCFLCELGFTSEEIERLISAQYRHLSTATT